MKDEKYTGYLFGPIIFGDGSSAGYSAIAKTTDIEVIDLVKIGQRGLQPTMRINKFSCSICQEDYETCTHKAGKKYGKIRCDAIMEQWEGTQVHLVYKGGDPRTRITDMLLLTEEEKQYAWYGFPNDIRSRNVHINLATENKWVPEKISQRFIKFFQFTNQGIATYPANPKLILEQGYRVDLLQTPIKMNENNVGSKKRNKLVMKTQIRHHPDRYNVITLEDNKYLYDKFDKILLPYPETMDFLMKRMKGGKIFWIKPKTDSIHLYVKMRTPKIRSYFKKGSDQYKRSDKSETFLIKLADQYVGKFVILSIDLKNSTKISRDLSVKMNSLLIGAYSQEISLVVNNYNGYVLKYQGDGVIAYFPIPQFWGMDDNALDCAIMMKFLIELGLNKILKEENIQDVKFRIGLDSGEAMVTTVGDPSNKQHKDLIGNTINLTTKIQSTAGDNQIVVGQTLWQRLGVDRRKLFTKYMPKRWDREIETVPDIYPLYRLTTIPKIAFI